MPDEIEEPRGLLALVRDHNNPERVGLRRLLCAAHGMSYAEVARVWAKVRARRNAEALARARKGDSSCGLGGVYPKYTRSMGAR